MFNTQIADIMKTFSAYEMNSFEKFVISPFFNKNEKVILLFRIMERYHPEFEDPGLKKEAVFREIFGKEKFDDKQMRYLSYELFNLAKEYVEYVGFKKDKFLPYYTRLTEFEKRKQLKFYEKTLLDAKKILKPSDFNKPDYYLYCALLQRCLYSYEFAETDREVKSEDFIKEIDNLICHFIISLTHNLYDSSMLVRKHNFKFDRNSGQVFLDNLDLEKIASYFKDTNPTSYSIIEMYYNLLMVLQDKDDSFFYRFRELLVSNLSLFTKYDLYNMYTNLESYCIRKVRNGDISFVNVQFGLYKEMLKHKVSPVSEGMYFNVSLFTNIVRTAIRNNELEWALKFIEEYGQRLHPDLIEARVNFCYGLVYFSKKDFEKSLESISKIQSPVLTFKEQLKTLTIKIYYELNLVEPMVYQLEAFRRFISQNKEVSEFWKENFTPFIKFTGDLVKIKDDKTEQKNKKLASLKESVINTVPLANKKWLLEKIGEINV